MMMGAIRSSETSVPTRATEDGILQEVFQFGKANGRKVALQMFPALPCWLAQSVVGIANGYALDDGSGGVRVPGEAMCPYLLSGPHRLLSIRSRRFFPQS
jgi:hypothetical protein